MKRLIALAAVALLLSLTAAAVLQGRKPVPVPLIPTLTGQVEYCLTCHGDLPEISQAHPVQTFGCVRCHGGEPLALNADLAHSTMRGGANPSDLAVVEASCGGSDCHSGSSTDQRDHIQRVQTGIQATYAGAIALMRYTYGAQPDLLARYGIQAVQAYQMTDPNARPALLAFDATLESSPSLQTFSKNCLDLPPVDRSPGRLTIQPLYQLFRLPYPHRWRGQPANRTPSHPGDSLYPVQYLPQPRQL